MGERSWSWWGAVGALTAGGLAATVAAALALTAPDVPTPPAATPTAATPAVTVPGPDRSPLTRIRIMPLGDSITAGIGTATFDSYRRDLYDRLTAAGIPVDFVGSQNAGTGPDNDHEGHSGWTIAKIAAHVDTWLADDRPDVILLHIGTNDMRTEDAARDAGTRLSALVKRIRAHAPDAQIVIAKLIGARKTTFQRRIDDYNRRIPTIVRAYGPGVRWVDQSSVDGVSLRDNLHPNDYGAAQMAWNWYQALHPVLNPGGDWPDGVDPYLATRAYLCELHPTYPHGTYVGVIACGWWQRDRPAARWVRAARPPAP